MADLKELTQNRSDSQQPSSEGSASALDEFFAEFYKSRFMYSLNERIKRAQKFVADGAYIDEALHRYNLSDNYFHAFLKQHPNSVRPDPHDDDEFSSFNEVMRYLKMPSPE